MKLNNKIILVTGGSSGIGLSSALMLKEKGATVIITGRNKEKLEKAAEENGLIGFVSDVSKEAEVKQLFQSILKQFGTLEVLINNAGFGYFELLENVNVEKFNDVLQTNVIGAALAAKEASKIFKEKNGGDIINIASTAATKGFAGGTSYVASKFALRGMTECWRAELRPYNIRVILINPSEVQTDFVVNSGRPERNFNPTKLVGEDIAHAIVSALEMENRGFITELTVFATNPKD
ncbi:MAG: SDR family oxidoreductase [Ignavibacteriales bacterium]|nr:SDR family oxidoreductase [Ignavibacteriales bacterium]MCB9209281.1 SDR family oxidoreductase [Ignavibacteriales bacterium]